MKSIRYNRAVGTADKVEHDFVLDVVKDKYILRACDITYDGQKYEMPSDQWFPDVSESFGGYLIEPLGAPGTVRLMVLDDALMSFCDSNVFSGLGKFIKTKPFMTAGFHGGTSGEYLVVSSACILKNKLDSMVDAKWSAHNPEDPPPSVAPSKELIPAILESDVNSLIEFRKKLNQSKSLPKTWDELSSEEKDQTMRKMAEHLGVVLKS